MKTIQRSISCIRGLLQEELDLVGGSSSSECFYDPSICVVSTPNGNIFVVDDMSAYCMSD
jgi:hypothetical protein